MRLSESYSHLLVTMATRAEAGKIIASTPPFFEPGSHNRFFLSTLIRDEKVEITNSDVY
jgi:hypothetical protein